MDIIFIVVLALLSAGLITVSFLYFLARRDQGVVKTALSKFEAGDFGYRIGGAVKSKMIKEVNQLGEKLASFFSYISKEERALADDLSRLQSVFSVLDDAIIAINKDRKVLLFNSQAEKMLNMQAEEAVGLSVEEVFTVFEGDTELPVHIYSPAKGSEAVSDDPDELNAGGQEHEVIVYSRKNLSLRTPGNRTREHSINLMTGRLSDDRPSGEHDINFLFIIKDVTSENKLERLKSDFVTVAAHQLRTPLSAVKWALKMMIDGDMGVVNPEQKSMLMKSYESNERMVALVNDLLDAEKLESSTEEYNLVPTDLTDLTDNLLLEHQPQAHKRGVVINKRGFDDPGLPMVNIDQDKVRAVLQNILENAIKYTPAGGMVTVSLESDEGGIKVGVTDTGIGIPHEEIGHIFTRFYRGSNAIRAHANGTGLGLFISKRIVEDHGGKIWFESGQGQGTTFYFTLPKSK